MVRPVFQPARVVLRRAAKLPQRIFDGRQRQAQADGCQHGGSDVLGVVVRCTAQRQRHVGHRAQVVLTAVMAQKQLAIQHTAGAAAGLPAGLQRRVLVTMGEQRLARGHGVRQACGGGHQHAVIGVQYQQAGTACVGRDRACHHQLHFGQVKRAVDAVFAQVVRADVGDDRHIGARHGQAAPQQAAACGFQQRSKHAGVAQHGACAGRARVVARSHRLPVDDHAFGAAMPGLQPGRRAHGRQQPHGGGLAVGAGDQCGRHVAQVSPGHTGQRRQ